MWGDDEVEGAGLEVAASVSCRGTHASASHGPPDSQSLVVAEAMLIL